MKDAQLKNKGRFGMNTRTCWLVVETKEESEDILLKYPGRILLVDQSYIRDTDLEETQNRWKRGNEIKLPPQKIKSTRSGPPAE